MGLVDYLVENQTQIIELVINHIYLTGIAVSLAIGIGVPIGILISYVVRIRKVVIGIASVIQAIPSLALLGFAIPFIGIGNQSAILVVTLYSLLPIIKNTVTGILSISHELEESAKGIGLTRIQILYKIELPLALPVIMAGVRIAAVTAVGLMTMAAFIGGGGLGYLVFSGIRSVNNYQILAGAIPACVLALLIDYLCALAEKLLVPKAMQLSPENDLKNINKERKRIKFTILFVVSTLIISMVLMDKKQDYGDRKVVVGSKDYTEQLVLGEFISILVEENTDIEVERKFNLGGTHVALQAINKKDIDMYVEYLGTAYVDVLKHKATNDVDLALKIVKEEYKEKYDIEVLEDWGFNNTFTLAVLPETSEKYGIKKISDLSKVAGDLKIGATIEFLNREDGLKGINKRYGLKFQSEMGIDGSTRYVALLSGEVDVIDAYLTDGLLEKFELVVLEDDLSFFVPYNAIPILRSDVSKKYPEIEKELKKLRKYLTEEEMAKLNYKVDELQMKPYDVAKEFLLEKKLINKK